MSASMQELIVNCLCVGAGGCVGAIARYLMGLAIPAHQSGFPLGTFAVNVIGAFAIAFIATWFLRHVGLDARLLLFLMTGVCGGFTTFSTFSLETLALFEGGKYATAALYAGGSLVACVLGVAAGKLAVRGALSLVQLIGAQGA